MMRYLGFLILSFKLLGWFHAASSDGDNQVVTVSLNAICEQIFRRPCHLPNLPVNNVSGCECVPEYRCNNKTTVITSGPQPIMIDRRTKNCDDPDEFCCDRRYIDGSTNNSAPTDLLIPANEGCGYRNFGLLLSRVTAENSTAEFAEFPWMVAVMESSLNDTRTVLSFKCGGSIIHPRAVLTSAHNVRDYVGRPGDLIVRAGEWSINSTTEILSHQDRQVETIILHERFNIYYLHNDFAILILRTALDIAQNVNTICLPEETDVFDGTRCIVTGWGKEKFGTREKFKDILKRIELPVITHNSCQTLFRSTILGQSYNLDQSFICAGGERNQDTCTGDGGGPLVCPLQNDQNRYVQAGIVSWGLGCGRDRLPGVYAKVSHARRWIYGKLAERNLTTPLYVA